MNWWQPANPDPNWEGSFGKRTTQRMLEEFIAKRYSEGQERNEHGEFGSGSSFDALVPGGSWANATPDERNAAMAKMNESAVPKEVPSGLPFQHAESSGTGDIYGVSPEGQAASKEMMASVGIPSVRDGGYSKAEVGAIQGYTEFPGVNIWLRGGGDPNGTSPNTGGGRFDAVNVPAMDAAVGRHETTGSITLFRGTTADLTGLKVGDTFRDPGFHSATTVAQQGRAFGRTQVVIDVPKGTNALYIGGRQGEVVLPRNTPMEVTRVDPVDSRGRQVVHMNVKG